MKGALKAGTYSAPVILSAATAHGVASVSPQPAVGGGTVTFLRSGIVQGTGFAANVPFLLILFNPPESGFHLLQPVMADVGGNFTLDAGSQFGVGTTPAPATVSGGNIVVRLVDTFSRVPPTVTPTPLPATSTPTATLTPTGVPGTKSPGPPIISASSTASSTRAQPPITRLP